MKKLLAAALALFIGGSALALPIPATYFQHVVVNDLGTSAAVITDGNRGLSTSVTTLAELAFVHGLSSNIQTQLGTKVDTMGAVGSSATGNAGVISGTTLTLEPAGATAPGVVTTGTQTFAGAKTATSLFTGNAGLSGVLTGNVTGTATGNTTYTPNQYGVVVSGSGNVMSVIAPVASTTTVLTSAGTGAIPTWAAASGGGSGGINYLTTNDTDFNISVGNWTAYADAAGTAPVDETGGSPTLTCTRATSSPLRGAGNLLITKDAANRQGNGCSVAFAPDSADQAKPLAVSFDYSIPSGTYADGDLAVYLYDVTNGLVIQPAPYTILNAATGLSQKWIGYFQTSAASLSYRLGIHAASTSASAYTVKVDNVIVGPTYQPYGAVVTDWQSYTPTTTNFGTTSGKLFFYRRVGDSLQVQGYFVAGTGSSSAGKVSLPTGLSIGSQITGDTKQIVGAWTLDTVSGTPAAFGNNQGPVTINLGDTATNVYFGSKGVSATISQMTGDFFNSGDAMSLRFTVPISGWSSNVQVSSDADTRVVAAQMTGATATITGSYSDITWSSVVSDTHGAMGAITYTVPVAGYYDFSGALNVGATSLSAAGGFMIALVNTTTSTTLRETQLLFDLNVPENESLPFNYKSIYLAAGTTVKFQVKTSGTVGTPVINASSTLNFMSVSRSAGPAQIAASEKAYLQYTGNAGTVFTAAVTNLDFTTKVSDSHSAWSGTVFTAPRAGWFYFLGSWIATTSVNTNTDLYINTVNKYVCGTLPATNQQHSFSCSTYMNAGDTASIRAQDTGGTLSNSAVNHWISISSQ